MLPRHKIKSPAKEQAVFLMEEEKIETESDEKLKFLHSYSNGSLKRCLKEKDANMIKKQTLFFFFKH